MMSAVDTFKSIKAEDLQAVDILKSKVHFCKNEQDWEEYKYCMNEAFNSVKLNWNVVFAFLRKIKRDTSSAPLQPSRSHQL